MEKVVAVIAVVSFLCLTRSYGFPAEAADYYQTFANDPTLQEQNYGRDIPNLIQGDILRKNLDTRHSVSNYQQTWTDNIIPYVLDTKYSSAEKTFIKTALNTLTSVTNECIKFVPRTSHKDYVEITKGDGCYGEVGRKGGPQTLSLGEMCYIDGSRWFNGTIFHEVMHALGFWHEHTRPNRDDYIKLNFKNIQKDHTYDFDKMGLSDVLQLQPYDYYSIMHYSMYTFAADASKPTFIPRDSSVIKSQIGQRSYLTEKDRERIMQLYRCDKLTECPEPRTPRYGSTYKLSNTKTGALSRYSCSRGYTLVGPQIRFCRNDGKWSGDNVVCLPAQAYPDFCDFDNTYMCNWSPQPNYGVWSRTSGSTETAKTGPVFDHTRETSDGIYMYMESSSPAKPGQKFRLRKRNVYYNKYPVCMSFYYSMYGQAIKPGSLRVFVTAPRQEEKLVWNDRDDKTPVNVQGWTRAEISRPMIPLQPSSAMDIIIEAERGSSWTGDIAIDDVLIVSCHHLRTYSSGLGGSSPGIRSRISGPRGKK